MTLPRIVVEDDLIAITRRTVGRKYLFAPGPELNAIVEYLLVLACNKFRMEPVAVCVMSDHYHLLARDVLGQHPRFTQWFHQQLADAVNALRGRKGSVMEGAEQVNVARVVDDEALLDHAAYILANPVAALAVARGRAWPGVRSRPDACIRGPLVVAKPAGLSAHWPEIVSIEFHAPPTRVGLDASRFASELARRSELLEGHHRTRAAREGRRFAGVTAVLAIPWTHEATSEEPYGRGRNLRPNVVARCVAARTAALDLMAQFRRQYARALTHFRRGLSAVFPPGTWNASARFGPRHAGLATAGPAGPRAGPVPG